jgi:hypothetical protein
MIATFQPLNAKQQLVRIALACIVLTPMLLIAVFWRQSLMAQHFGAVCELTIIACAAVSIFSGKRIRKIK